MAKGLVKLSFVTATSLSLGARKRNVTVLSACTSGETTGGGVCPTLQAAVQVKNANESKNVFFISPPKPPNGVLSYPSLNFKGSRRGMIQQPGPGLLLRGQTSIFVVGNQQPRRRAAPYRQTCANHH